MRPKRLKNALESKEMNIEMVDGPGLDYAACKCFQTVRLV